MLPQETRVMQESAIFTCGVSITDEQEVSDRIL